ncbi:MAG: hypothetical protein PSN37_04845 [Alphaproteobacteria bacterium]|nr:hypothetical protein [Alphaproteobacteria bacterium]
MERGQQNRESSSHEEEGKEKQDTQEKNRPLLSTGEDENKFRRRFSWKQDRENGILISADRMDLEMDNIFQAFNSILQGKISFDAPLRTVHGTESAPAFSFIESPRTGFYSKVNGEIGVTLEGTEIGTLSPDLLSHYKEKDNPHSVTVEQIGAVPASSYTLEELCKTLSSGGGEGSGINADLLDGIHKSDFVLKTQSVFTSGGLTGGGALNGDLMLDLSYASEQDLQESTDNQKVMTPLRTKQFFSSFSSVPVKIYFYGMKFENDNLIIYEYTGDEEYQQAGYLWTDITSLKMNPVIDDNGHFVLEI